MDNDVFNNLIYLQYYRRFPAEKKYLIKTTLRIGMAVWGDVYTAFLIIHIRFTSSENLTS